MIHLLESPPGALVGIVTRVFNEYGLIDETTCGSNYYDEYQLQAAINLLK